MMFSTAFSRPAADLVIILSHISCALQLSAGFLLRKYMTHLTLASVGGCQVCLVSTGTAPVFDRLSIGELDNGEEEEGATG